MATVWNERAGCGPAMFATTVGLATLTILIESVPEASAFHALRPCDSSISLWYCWSKTGWPYLLLLRTHVRWVLRARARVRGSARIPPRDTCRAPLPSILAMGTRSTLLLLLPWLMIWAAGMLNSAAGAAASRAMATQGQFPGPLTGVSLHKRKRIRATHVPI